MIHALHWIAISFCHASALSRKPMFSATPPVSKIENTKEDEEDGPLGAEHRDEKPEPDVVVQVPSVHGMHGQTKDGQTKQKSAHPPEPRAHKHTHSF